MCCDNLDFTRIFDGKGEQENSQSTQQNKNSSGGSVLSPEAEQMLFGLLCLRLGVRLMREFFPLIRGEVVE